MVSFDVPASLTDTLDQAEGNGENISSSGDKTASVGDTNLDKSKSNTVVWSLLDEFEHEEVGKSDETGRGQEQSHDQKIRTETTVELIQLDSNTENSRMNVQLSGEKKLTEANGAKQKKRPSTSTVKAAAKGPLYTVQTTANYEGAKAKMSFAKGDLIEVYNDSSKWHIGILKSSTKYELTGKKKFFPPNFAKRI